MITKYRLRFPVVLGLLTVTLSPNKQHTRHTTWPASFIFNTNMKETYNTYNRMCFNRGRVDFKRNKIRSISFCEMNVQKNDLCGNHWRKVCIYIIITCVTPVNVRPSSSPYLGVPLSKRYHLWSAWIHIHCRPQWNNTKEWVRWLHPLNPASRFPPQSPDQSNKDDHCNENSLSSQMKMTTEKEIACPVKDDHCNENKIACPVK